MKTAVKLRYSPPGRRDATGSLFREAMEDLQPPDYSGILYLAPASSKVREAQRIFHDLSAGKCYVPPEAATLRQFSKKLYSVSGRDRVVNNALVPIVLSILSDKGLGFSSVTADFISDLKQLYPESDPEALGPYFEKIFYELNIPESVSNVVYESLGTFNKYKVFMQNNGLVDEDDVLNISFNPPLISRHRSLIIDGFYDPTPVERNVIKYLIHNSQKVLISIPYDKQFKGLVENYAGFLKENFEVEETYLTEPPEQQSGRPIVYFAYPDIEEEVEGIARNIKALFVSGRFKDLEDVVVAFPDINKYAPMTERVFKRYGIPYNMAAKKPLGSLRPFLDLLSLLTSVDEDYPKLAFSQFLSSDYFSGVPGSLKEWVPSLSIQSGIVSGKESWRAFVAGGSEIIDIGPVKERAPIEADLDRVFRKLRPIEEIRREGTFGIFAGVLRGLLDELGFLSPPKDAYTRDLIRTTAGLIEQVFFIGGLHTACIPLSRFIEVFRRLLNTTFLETEGTGVRITDFSAAAGMSPEYLYLGGLTDSAMPGRQVIDYILPDSVRKRLGMVNLDKYIAMQRFAFNGVIRSGAKTHLSYALMDGEDVFIPSSFLYPGDQLREKVPGIFSREEHLVGTSEVPLSELITEIAVGSPVPPYAGGGIIRVTDIDAYRTCPRKFFIERVLRFRPLSVKEYEPEAATIGIIIHKIMERLVPGPFDNFEQLEKRAGVITDEVMRDKKISPYWKKLLRDSFMEILPDIYENELEIRKDGYLSTEAERNLVGEPVQGIKLNGKIDRFDRFEDGVEIIDYKTGAAGLTCTQVLKGNENLQLFLYAAIMKNHGFRVKRAGIYSLKELEIKWCPSKRKGKGRGKCEDREQGMDAYIIAALQFLEEAVRGLRSGDFTAKPLNDYICRNCHENSYCPYINS